VIVASELRFGAAKRNASRLTAQVEAILAAMDVRPFDAPADREYAKLRLHVEQAGTPIGPNDMLIAAHALATESILVTANTGEFSRVPGLAVQNWLEE
jgi:tRNA(fMet)-specific endonuclease VapC